MVLEHHELAGPQPFRDRLGRVDDIGEVGIGGVGQRGGDADDDDIGLIEPPEVDRGLEAPLTHLADCRVGDVADVTLPPIDPFHLRRVHVEAQDGDPAVAEGPGQRQADIAQADDPHPHGRGFDLAQERFMEGTAKNAARVVPPLIGQRNLMVVVLGHGFCLE